MKKTYQIFALLLSVFMTINGYSFNKDEITHSNEYKELITIFNEFRDFDQPIYKDGIVDYDLKTMDQKYKGLQEFQRRLKSIDTINWSVSDQINYHLLRAEMNGLEFRHRVVHPWKTNPNFYLQRMPLPEFLPEFPLNKSDLKEIERSLELIPLHFVQAKKNLANFSEVAGDLGLFAIHTLETHSPFDNLSDQLSENHPELEQLREEAEASIADYLVWLKKNLNSMACNAGVGKENYNWLLKNVYLMPYTWEDCLRILELEDNRVISFRELEKNKNRKLPLLKPASSQQEYHDSYMGSINHVINFLKKEEIMTVQDYLVPDEYLVDRGIYKSEYSLTMPWPAKHDYFFNFSLRESLMEETHELVGHHFDLLRSRNDHRVIRGEREHQGQHNVAVFRCEGFAFGLEELLMHAGYLDGRPPRSREIAYEQAAFRTVRGMSDVKMHAKEWSLTDAMEYCVANAPNGHLLDNSFHLWYEMETTLVEVGWHMAMVVGKVYFMKTLRDRAKQLGDDFVLKEFIDEYLAAGMIPPTLIRWEMTGLDDEIKNFGNANLKFENMIFNRRTYFISVLSLSFIILVSACQKKENSKIIYLFEENGKQNLWNMNADASEKVQITDLGFSVQWPDLSKDGKQIVFSSYDKGFEGLYTISSSGKNLKKLDVKMDQVDIPCWSHDDQNIAFMADRSQGILIADLDGNVIKSVAGNGVGGAYQRWSPIEPKLAIESGRDGNSEVYIINPSTDNSLKRLTADDQLDEWPIFSMDGSMIAWAHGEEGDMHTWIMNIDGSNKRLLTDEVTSGDGFASFSPDGSKVLFTCWAKEKPSIYSVNIDGSGLKKLSEGSHPMWMPK